MVTRSSRRKTLGEKLAQTSRSEFVNRLDEVQILEDALINPDIERNIIYIWGIGGIGKSTLLTYYQQICQSRSVPVCLINTQVHNSILALLSGATQQMVLEGRAKKNFSVFFESAQRYIDLVTQTYAAEGQLVAKQTVASGVLTGLEEGIPFGIGAAAIEMIGKEKILNLFGSKLSYKDFNFLLDFEQTIVSDFITGLQVTFNDKRIVIMFDHLETFPNLEWLKMSFLPQIPENALLVLSSRNRPRPYWGQWLPLMRIIHLEELSSNDSREYLHRRGVLNADLMNTIVGITRGLPLGLSISADFIGSLTAANLLSQSDEIPRLVVDELLGRILSQVENSDIIRALEVCSLVSWFNADVLAEMMDIDPLKSKELLAELRSFSFVKTHPNGYVLHDVVASYIASSLKMESPDRYLSLHEAGKNYFTRLLERKKGDRTEALLAVLRHTLATNPDEGLTMLRQVAEERLLKYDLDTVRLIIHESHLLGVPKKVQSQVNYYRAILLRLEHRWDDAEFEFNKILGDKATSASLRINATIQLGNVCFDKGQWDKAILNFKRCLELISGTQNPNDEGFVWNRLGDIYAYTEINHQKAYDCFEHSIKCYTKADNQVGIGEVFVNLANISRMESKWGQACEYALKAIAVIETLDPYEHFRALDCLAHVYRFSGDFIKAREFAERSLELAEKLKNDKLVGQALDELGHINVLTNGWHNAESAYRSAMALFDNIGYQRGVAVVTGDIGELEKIRGNIQAAYNHIEASRSYFASVNEPFREAIMSCRLGDVLRLLGQYSQSRNCLEDALKVFRTGAYGYREAEALYYLGLLCLDRGEQDTGVTTLEQSLAVFKRHDMTYFVVKTEIALLSATWIDIADDSKITTFNSAVDSARQLGYVDLLATLSVMKGRLHLKSHQIEQAAHHYAESLKLSRQFSTELFEQQAKNVMADRENLLQTSGEDLELEFRTQLVSKLLDSNILKEFISAANGSGLDWRV
jgi:tetratricopeptide (TPR) repeat protein